MPDTPVPWVGLAALAAMFLLPLLPDWLFEGPRTSKHWLRRHSLATARSRGRRAHLHPQGERGRPGPSWPAAPASRSRSRRPGGNRPGRPRSGFAAWCAFSAFGRAQPIGIAAPLGRSCEVVSRAGGAARALPGHQGEAS
jgi:hypothetical protein